ncbi:hypothetical protein, partial [Mycolicibacterium insubricum]|uniref:hypothetical protein n=1 Tax=Mycolicibacterium insubricum TaxID=444597 RepID=UPI0021F2667C
RRGPRARPRGFGDPVPGRLVELGRTRRGGRRRHRGSPPARRRGRIGIMLRNQPAHLAALLGVLMAGATVVG